MTMKFQPSRRVSASIAAPMSNSSDICQRADEMRQNG
jgi:hypothetical protein